MVATFFDMLQILGGANTVLAALVIGTLLQLPRLRSAIPIVAVVIVIKLLLQPGVAVVGRRRAWVSPTCGEKYW